MREEALGSKPLAEAVQAVLLEHLNMKTELEVLEQRVFRAGLWKNDYQFVWIRWFMDYPDPHNEYFDTFYGKKTEGKRQAWVNDAFDQELETGRDTRDRQEATRRTTPRPRRSCRPTAATCRWRGSLGGRGQARRAGLREEQAGRDRRRWQHLRRHALATSTSSRKPERGDGPHRAQPGDPLLQVGGWVENSREQRLRR